MNLRKQSGPWLKWEAVIKMDEGIQSVIVDVKLLDAAEDVTVTCIKSLRQLLECDNTNEL